MKIKRFVCYMLLFLTLCGSAFSQENDVWKTGNQIHVEKVLDCDGIPLVIDTDVLIPEQSVACNYELGKMTVDELRAWEERMNWTALGFFGAESLKWSQFDSILSAYNSGQQLTGVLSEYHFFLVDDRFGGVLEYYDSPVPERGQVYNVEPFDSFDFSDVAEYAEHVAREFGIQLGEANRVYRLESEHFSKNDVMMGSVADYFEDRNGDIQMYVAWFPVYYQDKRLHSYRYGMTSDQSNVRNCALKIVYTEEGPKALYVPFVNGLIPTSDERRILTYEEAIESIREHFAETFLPGVERIELAELAMEYIPYCNKPPYSRYTVYPAWRAKVVIAYSGEQWQMINMSLNACSGEVMYAVR